MKNFIGRMWRKAKLYGKLPEMRLFWIFLPLLIMGIVGSLIYLPPFVRVLGITFFAVIAIVVLLNNIRLAKSNLEIKIEHSQFDYVIQNLESGVIFYDQDFKIIIFNKAAERIFGLHSADVIGQFFTPDKAKDLQSRLLAQVIYPSLAPRMVQRSEAGKTPQIMDISFEEPRLELRVVTMRIIDSSGTSLGFMKIVNDRTRAIELLRSKSEFITVAAHQLRTPLTAVNWIFEMLVKNEGLKDEERNMVTGGFKAGKKLEKIVNDLLDVSKIEEGRFGYNFEDIDIVSFVEKLLTETAQIAVQYKVNIFFERPPQAPLTLRFDPARIGIAFSNILDNAIKYNVENGQVIVKLEKLPAKPFVQISIKDTGVGIPSDQIKNLFTKFFRAENVMKFETEGTGLGLYIAKNIVKRHGGEIWAESELNRGTTIYFTIPADPTLIPPSEFATYGEE